MFGKTILAALSVIFMTHVSVLNGEDVASFLDDYSKAIAEGVSISANISCKTYVDNLKVPVHSSGIVSWNGGSKPFMILTILRKDDTSGPSSGVLYRVTCRGDRIFMTDGMVGLYYDEALASTGTSLMAARLDKSFLVLMFPHFLDDYLDGKGRILRDEVGMTKARSLYVDKEFSHLELVLDAVTNLPLKIDQTVYDADGRAQRTVLELSNIHVSNVDPPEVLFDVNRLFQYPQKRYDPLGLFSIPKAPEFEVDMLDGTPFSLSKQLGKWVFISFHSKTEAVTARSRLYLDRAGDIIRQRGGVFIDVYPSAADDDGVLKSVYSLANSCRSDVIARMYGMKSSKMPCVILVAPDGSVSDMLEGYIPGLSERAIEKLMNECLPPPAEPAPAQ